MLPWHGLTLIAVARPVAHKQPVTHVAQAVSPANVLQSN